MNIKRIGLIGGNSVQVGGSGGTGGSTTVVDNLDSISKSAALSANMGRELNETKAPKIGYAPDLKVSYAEELVGRGDSTAEIIASIRPTSGKESSIKDGNATIERIEGNSVVWNQLIRDGKTLQNNVSILAGRITLNYIQDIVSDGYINLIALTKIQGYENKKCLATVSHPKFKIGNCWTSGGSINGYNYNYKFFPQTSIISIGLYPDTDLDFGIYTFDIAVYDLTLMFGAGNEPTTIEEFEARKPLGVTNEYNEGTIVSFQGGDVKSVGFNAWDEEWELGGFFGGNKQTLESYSKTIRSKNYIPVIGGCEYFVTSPIAMYANFFDKQYKYINASGRITSNSKIVVPSNAAYMWIRNFDNSYGTTYNHDICIHLVHSGYRNGDYEPYVDDIHPLPNIKSIKDNNGDTLFPYGLLSAGGVHDEITATKAIKRVGHKTLNGTEKWELELYGMKTFKLILLKDNAIQKGQNVNWLSNRYENKYWGTNWSGIVDKMLYVYNSDINFIGVIDTAYTTVEEFKNSLVTNPITLYYELAEPIEVDLEEPLNMTYEAWDFGTEELISNDATTPLNADIVYQFNAVDRIRENSSAIDVLEEHNEERKNDGIKLLDNGNLELTLKGETREFMPATPSGDPMHYAYIAAGAEYNVTTNFIVKDAPWKNMVDTIEDKAKWGFDVVDASQVKQITIGGTTYNYVQTTRTSPEGTTEPRYFLVGKGSNGVWVEDETKVLHLPGHWYLNGLGDITGPEIALCYVQTMPWYAATTLTKAFRVQQDSDKITLRYRTTFRSNREFATIASNIDCESMCYSNTYIEVFILTFMTQKVNVIINGLNNAFTNANNMKYLIGQLYSSTSITLPNNIRSLSITISQIVNFAKSSYISKPSILYIIRNAMPSVPITITLHADRYAQLAQDVDIVAALETKNAALQGTSGSISLVSA